VSALSSHVLEEIKELPAKYPQPRSAVMPALDLAQEELGHLTPEAMSEVLLAVPSRADRQASVLRLHQPQLRAAWG